MPWIRLEADFPDHPKVIGLDDHALALHVRAICYAGRYLTDGLIGKQVIPKLGRRAGVAALLAAGLWETAEGGAYRIHDFLQYQPSRREALERREALHATRAEAGRASVEARRRRAAEPPLALEPEYGAGRHEERRPRSAEPPAPTPAPHAGSIPATNGEQTDSKAGANRDHTGNPIPSHPDPVPIHIQNPAPGAARSPGLEPVAPRFAEALRVLAHVRPRVDS